MPKTNSVSIDGVVYESVAQASRDLGLNFHTVHGRLESKAPAWMNWQYVDGERATKEKPQKKEIPVCYQYIHLPTKKFYVGSTIDVAGRKASHEWRLRNNHHPCKKLQELWSSDNNKDNWQWMVVILDDREKAFDHEQETMNKYKDTGLLLNMVYDARSPISDVAKRGGLVEKTIASKARIISTYSAEQREAMIEKIRQGSLNRWAKDDSREGWSGAGNPFSKKVAIDGVIYGSVKEAMRLLNINEKTIRTRANSSVFPNYTFVIPENGVEAPKLTDEQKKELSERLRKSSISRWTNPESKEKSMGSNNPNSKKLYIDGVQYDCMKDAADALKVNPRTISNRLGSCHFPNYSYAPPKDTSSTNQ